MPRLTSAVAAAADTTAVARRLLQMLVSTVTPPMTRMTRGCTAWAEHEAGLCHEMLMDTVTDETGVWEQEVVTGQSMVQA